MENQCLASNFSGDHLSLTCGHSHLLVCKVGVSATCGCSQPPLVTGLPGLHDNAASADVCR